MSGGVDVMATKSLIYSYMQIYHDQHMTSRLCM